jgi:hypothetical protein
MANRCSVCAHPRRAQVDATLRGSYNVTYLARDLGVTRQSLIRHRTNHLPPEGTVVEPQSQQPDDVGGADEVDEAPPQVSQKVSQNPQNAFLTSYAANGDLRKALQAASITRAQLRKWQEHDEEFNLRFHQAQAEAVETLEAEARIRAVAGSRMVRRVFRQGLLYEEIHEWRPSDAMLVKLLQANLPEKYTDKLTVTQTTVVKAVDAEAWNSV